MQETNSNSPKRIMHEGGIIVRVNVLSQPRFAIALPPGLQRLCMEGLHLRMVRCLECDVHRAGLSSILFRGDPEAGFHLVRAEANGSARDLNLLSDAEGSESSSVERDNVLEVCGGDGPASVIEHCSCWAGFAVGWGWVGDLAMGVFLGIGRA